MIWFYKKTRNTKWIVTCKEAEHLEAGWAEASVAWPAGFLGQVVSAPCRGLSEKWICLSWYVRPTWIHFQFLQDLLPPSCQSELEKSLVSLTLFGICCYYCCVHLKSCLYETLFILTKQQTEYCSSNHLFTHFVLLWRFDEIDLLKQSQTRTDWF